jgi:hypothetical protein
VARLFKIQESAVERLFSGKPLRVKQAVDADAASRYRAAFREIGALVQIVPSGSPPPAPTQPADVDRAPAESAADRAGASPSVPPAAGVSGASLAEPGATIDLTPPPPPAEIDTSGLEALPPNSGTLEDCKVEKPHRPIPDIGHLKLIDD